MRFYFDTEFIEDGKTIELISIGIVAEDGRELYLGNADCDLSRANDWVTLHVLPKLPRCTCLDGPRPPYGHYACPWRPSTVIAEMVAAFVQSDGTPAEFWAYYADYDWVVLCQLFGPMIKLPKGFPMMCMDLMQLAIDRGFCRPDSSLKSLVPQEAGEHDALEDARWNKRAHDWLREKIALGAAFEEGWRP